MIIHYPTSSPELRAVVEYILLDERLTKRISIKVLWNAENIIFH